MTKHKTDKLAYWDLLCNLSIGETAVRRLVRAVSGVSQPLSTGSPCTGLGHGIVGLHTFHCAYRVASCSWWSGSSWSSLVAVNPIGFGIWRSQRRKKRQEAVSHWTGRRQSHAVKSSCDVRKPFGRGCGQGLSVARASPAGRRDGYLRRGAFSAMSSRVSREERWETSLRLEEIQTRREKMGRWWGTSEKKQ